MFGYYHSLYTKEEDEKVKSKFFKLLDKNNVFEDELDEWAAGLPTLI